MAKSSSKKKSTAKKKSASKAKSSPKAKKTSTATGTANSKAKAGKAPPQKGKKKGADSDLLLRKFDDWQPETLYVPPKEDRGDYAAPPIAEGKSADAVRALLLKSFDLKAAPAGKADSKKKAPPPKKETAAKPPAKKKAAPPKKAAEAPPPQKAPASTKELLARKFDEWTPKTRYAPPPEKVEPLAAPPIAAGADAERVKALLLKPIDLSDVAEAPVQPPEPESATPAAAAEPTPAPVSIGEVLQRKFESWRPDKLYAPPETRPDIPAAPPIATGAEAERVKGLLFRQFDLSDVPPASEEVKTADRVAAQEAKEEAAPETQPAQAVPKSPTEVPEEVKASDEVAAQEAKADVAPETEPSQAVPKSSTEVPEEVKASDEVATQEAKADAAPESEPAQAVPKSATTIPEEVKTSGEVATEEAKADAAAAEMRETASQVVRPAPVYRPDAEWEASDSTERETSEAQVPPIPPQKKGSDPMERSMKFLAACAIILFAIIVGVSFSNASKYYLKSTDDGLEIWKGSFAPMGDERVVRLRGVAAPASMQGVYEKEQVMPIAFNYYMDKAEDVLYEEGVADQEKVRGYIDKALHYADAQNAKRAFAMQKNLRILSLMTMADVAATKGTPEGYEKAVGYLEQAAAIDRNDIIDMGRTSQAPLIEKKLAAYKGLLEAETPETEEAETE